MAVSNVIVLERLPALSCMVITVRWLLLHPCVLKTLWIEVSDIQSVDWLPVPPVRCIIDMPPVLNIAVDIVRPASLVMAFAGIMLLTIKFTSVENALVIVPAILPAVTHTECEAV